MCDVDWVRNEIELHHTDTSAIKWIVGILQNATGGIFESISPVDCRDEIDLYDLCEAKWGTPEDIYPTQLESLKINLEEHGGTIYCVFDTAWTSPLRILEELRKRGFDVNCWSLTREGVQIYWINGEAVRAIKSVRAPTDGVVGFNVYGDQVEVLLSREHDPREMDYSIHIVTRSWTAIRKELDCIQRLSDGTGAGADHCEASYLKGKRDALAWVSPKCHEAMINPDCTAQNQG